MREQLLFKETLGLYKLMKLMILNVSKSSYVLLVVIGILFSIILYYSAKSKEFLAMVTFFQIRRACLLNVLLLELCYICAILHSSEILQLPISLKECFEVCPQKVTPT